ncbi:MAG: UPF0149 family protein [Pseudomonadales bacterium]|nr:UPF0149 family protein [Pseudomonadales bacterium]
MDPELLNKAHAASTLIEPAELHGLVCGLASANPGTFSMPEFIDLVGADTLTDDMSTQEFVTATLDQLHAQDMEFHLLVPDDEESLGARVAATANWCAAFLSAFGIGLGNLGRQHGELADDVQEILRDFVALSGIEDELDEDDPDAGEQDESAFMEVYEYVRVAAILIHTLMHDFADDGDPSNSEETIH